MCVLQAAAQAANSEAEIKIASLTTQLSTAQASCADASSQLQLALTDFATKTKATEEQHHAALAALQLQLSDRNQQLRAAAEKEAECTAAIDEAAARILAQESDINMLNVQLEGIDQHRPCYLVLIICCNTATFTKHMDHSVMLYMVVGLNW